jgi:general nucleoside transport system permease protein
VARWWGGIWRWLVIVLAALGFTTIMLLFTGAPPLEAFRLLFLGAFQSPIKLSDTVMLATPLLLCAAGLTVTFAAGLYHLGIEGQMTMGAVCAMIPLRLFAGASPLLLWVLAFAAGMAGGVLWGVLIAALRQYGRVNEIFAGLGLNFLATGVALYLVFGPWKRPGIASMSGTERLPTEVWLPTLEGLRLAPVAPLVALVGWVLVWMALSRTHWGLSVRAAGQNPAAARRLGVPSVRRLFEALAVCGVLAGAAGTLQVLAVFHALIPNISSGLGLMGLLIALLVQARPGWVLLVVVVFASFSVGSVGLPLQLKIDSSMSGVLQGALVLFALAWRGWQQRG